MAIRIVVSPTVKFKVRGTLKGATGQDEPFDFSLTCRRLDTETISDRVRDAETSVVDFMLSVIEDWAGVKDGNDQPLAFSEAAYRDLCKIPGIAQVAFRQYLSENGAKEKN